jgi:hypothetical protein
VAAGSEGMLDQALGRKRSRGSSVQEVFLDLPDTCHSPSGLSSPSTMRRLQMLWIPIAFATRGSRMRP